MSKKILLRSMETEFIFPNSRSLINFLMLSAQDPQDLKDIIDSDLMDLDLMEKEEVETVAHSKVNLRSMTK
jgi:hypothetical protein